jgi:protein TonB
MFDSVTILGRSRRRFGAPAAVSIALHVLIILLAIPATTAIRVAQPPRPEHPFVLLTPRRPTVAAAPQGATPAAKPAPVRRKKTHKPLVPAVVIAPTAIPMAEPPPAEPPAPASAQPPAQHEALARPDGIAGGMGTAGASSAGTAMLGQGGPIEFDDALMSPPERLSGPDPDYTYLARAYEVQGLMVVKCVVTTMGVVRDCRVLQGLPYMNEAVVEALLRRRYAPARLANGTAVDVDYTFRIRLQLVR